MLLPLRQCLIIFIGLSMLSIGVTTAHPRALTPGKLYVVGVGPAGPEHATMRALEVIKGADYIVCNERMKKRFPVQLKGKTILTDPLEGMFEYKGTRSFALMSLPPEEKKAFRKERIKIREKKIQLIKDKLKQGKTVALLESGDPCIFGPSHWFIEGFDPEQVEIIPGVGAFPAAMAALKKPSISAYDTRFVMITSPYVLPSGGKEAFEVFKDTGKHPTTMVFYMALHERNLLIPLLKKFYPGDLPVAVVYYAGYPDKEKVVQGTLDNILDKIAKEKEPLMGMIIVGRCLEGKPTRAYGESWPP